LHAQGITGKDVGIAILDHPLLTAHEEYAAQLAWYEDLDAGERGSMHGGAVASIAVGRTAGVAPGASLFFIGIGDTPVGILRRCSDTARGIRRLLEVNERLPAGKKIRVISMSSSCYPSPAGHHEFCQAVQEAQRAGMFVVSSDLQAMYGFRFHGMGRAPLSDPDDYGSFQPASWGGWMLSARRDRLLVPMESRATASPTGEKDYVFYSSGGWSWSIPYLAGVYALAAQVDAGITPQRFWAAALKTGRMTFVEATSGAVKPFGPIIDPPALVAELAATRPGA
jgi:hypothetical protein